METIGRRGCTYIAIKFVEQRRGELRNGGKIPPTTRGQFGRLGR